MNTKGIEQLKLRERTPFGMYPTPLESAPRLAEALGTRARLLLKRDDYTGFGLGGNKVRKLEYVLTPDGVAACDVILTTGSVTSNHARVTAACAAKLGKRCILVLNGNPSSPARGNALLQQMYGAQLVHVSSREERAPRMAEIAGELRTNGQHPLVVPLGASTPEGTLGYAAAALEILEQLNAKDVKGAVWIFVSSSSCGTLGGLLLGFTLAHAWNVRIVGVSADESERYIRHHTRRLAESAGKLLASDITIKEDLLFATDDYIGEGYGISTEASREATHLFATHEGCILDPTYSAKAAAGMIDWIRAGHYDEGDTVVFWHTGGIPQVFAL